MGIFATLMLLIGFVFRFDVSFASHGVNVSIEHMLCVVLQLWGCVHWLFYV